MKVLSRQGNSEKCIVCGLDNDLGVKASFYNLEDGSVGATFVFKDIHQSYPDRVHGGLISALLDEIMGRIFWDTDLDTVAVTTSLTVKFRKPVPYFKQLKARAVAETNSKGWYSAKAFIYDEDNNLLAESTGRFIKVKKDKVDMDNIGEKQLEKYKLSCDKKEIDFPSL